MQFGVSYFGIKNPHHFQQDLAEIVRLGFAYIVFTFSEEDHRFYQGSLAACVRATQQAGLSAYVDPWGVGGVFGGEAFTEQGAWEVAGQQRRSDGRAVPLLCPNSDELRAYLRQWLATVATVLRADGIFWDEPHFYTPRGVEQAQGLWGCCCPRCQARYTAAYHQPWPTVATAAVRQSHEDAIATLLGELMTRAAAHGLRNVVCLAPTYEALEAFQARCAAVAAHPHLDVLATAPYPRWYGQPLARLRPVCEAVQRAGQRYRKGVQIWIQGFGIPAGEEAHLGDEMRLLAQWGIQDIAIWSYVATAYMSSHACADAPRAWDVVTTTMHALRQPSGPG